MGHYLIVLWPWLTNVVATTHYCFSTGSFKEYTTSNSLSTKVQSLLAKAAKGKGLSNLKPKVYNLHHLSSNKP